MERNKITKIILIVAVLGVASAIWLIMRGQIVVDPEINLFGVLTLRWYGLIILSGIVAANLMSKKLIQVDKKLAKIDVVELLLCLVIPGVIGARIYHVVTDFHLYADDLSQIFNLANGGLGFVGAVMGGLLGLFIFTRWRRDVVVEKLIAVIVTVLPLAQGIGRLGNLINQELYGEPTALPWGMYVRPENRVAGYEQFSNFHPLFLYEMLANFVLCALLIRLYRRGERGYRLFVFYLAGYGVIRYILDFMRLEGVSGVYGLSYTQWLILALYILAFLFGVGYQVWYRRRNGVWFTEAQNKN